MSNNLTIKPPITTIITKIKDEIILIKKMETEKTITYWIVSKHIHEHLLNNRDCAN